ncbi:type VI secretion system ImpA family N-terminal domain-containing protein [Methylobacterium sp. J-076]|uniref:type VI secretion system ImpA family N-terminal domain-containing protein n=1 Tax=Methylobacterium sp. J-076 TaxID=2836655 RepID=UPI001FBACC61|nr:type VI secretion system ImpA family N-terminal domain-containing protein [Methylobacterium sp. J-076]MCJ2012720.1 type VI secretion system ImpA family N-terminal domain-containing protein [Methylobacterium sp. J-076]
MALAIDPAEIVKPIGIDSPCGDDLDEEGDLDFLNGLARVEGQLPASFLTRDEAGDLQTFDRSTIDFERESKLLLGLLDRTRDLRLLALLGRLAMLNRDLVGFGHVACAVEALLRVQWDTLHPRGDADGFELRAAVIQTLEDNPTVILPLQHLPLFHSRRYGHIDFRALMIADGEVAARGSEPGPDRVAVERALAEADPEALQPVRNALTAIAHACEAIEALTASLGGHGARVALDRLHGIVGRMLDFLKGAAPVQAPAAEPAPHEPVGRETVAGPEPVAAAVGAISTTAQAGSALAAAAAYLRRHEPSSPAEVLVRQAQDLIGRSFVDVMRILMPSRASETTIALGSSRGLRLSFDQLAAVPGDGEDGPVPEATADAGEGEAETAFHVGTRAEMLALLRQIGGHFRRVEPASPIPLLLDKAVGFADRDFLAILKDVLAEGHDE